MIFQSAVTESSSNSEMMKRLPNKLQNTSSKRDVDTFRFVLGASHPSGIRPEASI